MVGESGRLRGFSSVFTVADVAASLAFYGERLGFSTQFAMGEPPSYAIIERETVSLHLMPASRDPKALGLACIYVYAHDVDGLHQELVARGCPIELAPIDLSYGMREMSVRDPDGNRITFGQDLSA
jgi:catechol 2,3-dioxygenase-like lactoylglutathione lyase family enzyme